MGRTRVTVIARLVSSLNARTDPGLTYLQQEVSTISCSHSTGFLCHLLIHISSEKSAVFHSTSRPAVDDGGGCIKQLQFKNLLLSQQICYNVFIWKIYLLLIVIFRNSHSLVPPVHPKEYFLKIPSRVYLAFFSFPLLCNASLNNSLPILLYLYHYFRYNAALWYVNSK